MPTSVIIAAVIGLVIAIIGGANLTGILMISGFLGLTVWALTGFRIGKPKAVNVETTPSSLHVTSVSNNTDQQDMSSLSPKDVGRVLAISLDASCKAELSKQEVELLSAAKIPLAHYQRENTILAGFAQINAIQTLIKDINIQKEVRDGYLEVWANMAKSSAAGAELYQLFFQRCPYYEEALQDNESRHQQYETIINRGLLPVSISRIASTFGEFLAANNQHALLLALASADAIYTSHFDGAALVFNNSKLT